MKERCEIKLSRLLYCTRPCGSIIVKSQKKESPNSYRRNPYFYNDFPLTKREIRYVRSRIFIQKTYGAKLMYTRIEQAIRYETVKFDLEVS